MSQSESDDREAVDDEARHPRSDADGSGARTVSMRTERMTWRVIATIPTMDPNGDGTYTLTYEDQPIAEVSLTFTHTRDGDGRRDIAFDASTDVDIAVLSSAVRPSIQVSGAVSRIGQTPVLNFSISISSANATSTGVNTTAVASGRANAAAALDGLTLGATGPESTRTRSTTIASPAGLTHTVSGRILVPPIPGVGPQLVGAPQLHPDARLAYPDRTYSELMSRDFARASIRLSGPYWTVLSATAVAE